MAKLKLTASSVVSMKPGVKRLQVFDTEQRGLCLRITPSGEKVFSAVYKFQGRMKRFTIGKFPDVSLADARKATRDKLSQVADGVDPQKEKLKERAAGTFKELAEDYFKVYVIGPDEKKPRKKSSRDQRRMIDAYLLPEFQHSKPSQISRTDVRSLLDGIADGAPIQANRVLSLLRKMFNWAIEREIVDSNPCVPMEKPGVEQSRDRILTDDEISAVWRAAELEKAPMSALPKLLLLTLKRSGETCVMRWQDLDFEAGTWRIPAAATKTNQEDLVPLTRTAIEILQGIRTRAEKDAKKHKRDVSSWVFPNPRDRQAHMTNVQKLVERVRDNSKIDGVAIAHWTGHDLRRTGRSYMGMLQVPPHISERLMGHKQQGVKGVYDRYDYFQERADALEKWSKKLTAIVSGLKIVKQDARA